MQILLSDHFEIPASFKFTIDGKNVTVHELKPGMKFSAMICTTTAPTWVDTVWKTVGSSLIIKTPEGENKMYRVPSGGKITIDGTEKTLDQLHEEELQGENLSLVIPRSASYARSGRGYSSA